MTREYILKRSARKSVSLEVTEKMRLLVRAPYRMPVHDITKFVDKNSAWIEAHIEKQRRRAEAHPELTADEIKELKQRAKEYLPERTAVFCREMNLYPEKITITSAKKRFGSCSGKNTICFSWRLMRYPQEAIDYVIVHELAHIKHKNHGRDFYSCIASVMPDYKQRKKLLKE